MTQEPKKPGGRRWRRRVLFALAALAVAALLAFGSLPWILSTAPGRSWLLARANAALAPARLEVGSFGFSWFGPTRMTEFAIIDHRGDSVVHAPTAVWDRNLWQALFDKPRYGTLTLEQCALDVERSEDGTI